jgi:hypothetical protein
MAALVFGVALAVRSGLVTSFYCLATIPADEPIGPVVIMAAHDRCDRAIPPSCPLFSPRIEPEPR